MDAALKEEKCRLEPALKRARLYDRAVKMDDIKKWRIENYNLEKRPCKFNSWVPTSHSRSSKRTSSSLMT